MARLFNEPELIIATHNPGKLREIAALLTPFGMQVLSAGDLGLPEPMEDGLTFAANAKIKARAAVEGSDKPALADDSGLVVPALDGKPGIYSARWAGQGKDFNVAMKRIQNELGNKSRRAYFVAALALAWPDGHMEVFEGEVHGTLVWPPRGRLGFGYDSMFQPDGFNITYGEFEPSAKHAISHRAKAFDQLVAACFAP